MTIVGCDIFKTKQAVFEVPCGYSGRLVIEFDCPNGQQVTRDENGRLVYRFGESGKLSVSNTISEFVETQSEIYRWSCDGKEYERTLGATKMGSSWTGGKELNINEHQDYSEVKTYGPTAFTYFCTYVWDNPDFAKDVLDSLKASMKDCASYPDYDTEYDRCNWKRKEKLHPTKAKCQGYGIA